MQTVIENLKTHVGTRLPHEVVSLLRALHRAARGLLDSDATLNASEEMYAVFEEESGVCALAILCVGFSRYARSLAFSAEETPHKILLRLTGVRRKDGDSLDYRDILPEREACRRALDSFLTQNRMAYEFAEREGELCLTVAFPRFLADSYDVCAVDAENICGTFYNVMLFLAGDEPKRPLPLV
ncbi:MAG: hypothetical protein E7609_01345 [Ruminococcaceae bacterium]|nr:hypothetical protein [Oscillospiraceae bacterium]